MKAIAGVFQTRADAEQALGRASKAGVPAERITLLTPGTAEQENREIQSVPVDESEQPGMGKAIGALIGGGVGLTAGAMLVALVPGLGPITALGLLGEAILTAAGATVGAGAGSTLENSLSRGLPEDEIFVYEDALRKGRSVVIGLAEDDAHASQLRELFNSAGAESVDAAREQWWIGLRSAEESQYPKSGRSFAEDEQFFRMGFEAAQHARTRCMEFDEVSAEMDAAFEEVQRQFPGRDVEEPFTHGYQRGREYYQRLCDEKKAA